MKKDVKELVELIKQICVIPSPTRQEKKKAMFIKKWLKEHGAQNCVVDEKNNVILELGEKNAPKVVFIAHIDTVYSMDTKLEIFEDKEILKCPSVGDNSANVAGLMLAFDYINRNKIKFEKVNPVFVFSACEESLGNSDGCRHFMKTHNNVKEMIVVDGFYDSLLTNAVGSHRYKITVSTKGGHSFDDFGSPNAIQILSQIINDFYAFKLPKNKNTKTTLNVGVIEGGSGVTAIANFASMLCEYRSDNFKCLMTMKKQFDDLINCYKNKGYDINVELVGERPCCEGVDEKEQEKLVERVENIIEKNWGKKPIRDSLSTDGSIALSMGIPATSVSVYIGKGCHSAKEELLYKNSLVDGFKILIDTILSYK